MKTIKYGILGSGSVNVDDNGFIEVPVIIQESGCYVGIPPLELRIVYMGIFGDDEFNKQYVAKLNEKTDLPYYLATAKIKVDNTSLVEWNNKMLAEHNIKPLTGTLTASSLE